MKISKLILNQLILESFKEIIDVMIKNMELKDNLKIVTAFNSNEEREVAILIQFIGGVEGKIVLSCSLPTALHITKTILGFGSDKDIRKEEQREYIKDSLGELMNMLAGKIAFSFQKDYGTTRITTPTIVNGSHLIIKLYDENAISTYLETIFGIVEITLSTN